MNIKSIMLGTAAGFVAVSGVQAADLPGEPLPVAVDYVKVCDTFGAGFFYIPGTDTCLDISGRVRFRVEYEEDAPVDDDIRFEADGRVDFDARTMTEYGQLRSFFRIGNEDADGSAEIDAAYIQLGYLTVGYAGDLFNGDVLYGDDVFAYTPGDQDRVQVTLLANNIGGGFYAGVSLATDASGVISSSVDNDGELQIQAAVGMANQPWGSIDLSAAYLGDSGNIFAPGVGDDAWAVKATANLALIENLNARLVAAYANDFEFFDSYVTLAGALAYTAGPATIYTGVRYDILDDVYTDDHWGANLGVDYAVVPGLVATAEVSYEDFGATDEIRGLLQLSRTW